MARYRVNNNAQSNGDHEVHRETCPYYPVLTNYRDLGDHFTCHSAVAAAKMFLPTADGCAVCSPDCHTG